MSIFTFNQDSHVKEKNKLLHVSMLPTFLIYFIQVYNRPWQRNLRIKLTDIDQADNRTAMQCAHIMACKPCIAP